MLAVALIDVRVWLRFAYVLYGLSLILLVWWSLWVLSAWVRNDG